jgi:GH25 family lysozyme M1 (1,4-beta-N-acetylmuramidase)|tara:strand:- start:492 stop:773 length:282 start_codon:yes stop_codon:yes gene_type:complete
MTKTFKDLIFKSHPSTRIGIQAVLSLNENIDLSVVAGEGFYSSTKKEAKGIKHPDSNNFISFEVGIITDNKGIDVIGWQTREDINNIIKKYSG